MKTNSHFIYINIFVFIILEAYQVEDLKDYNWAMMGMAISLLYHFTLLNGISIVSITFNIYIKFSN